MEIKRLIVGALDTNCYLLIAGKEMIIVDPGSEPEKILDEIKKTGAKPEYIINTHYHPDHTGANKGIRTSLSARTLNTPHLKKETGVKILIHEAEKSFISFKPDGFLKGGEKIKIGDTVLKVIHTPGHSPGSICLLGKDFALTGDTIFKDGYGRTDLKGGSWEDLDNSLKKLKKLLKPGMRIYPGHGDIFRVKVYL